MTECKWTGTLNSDVRDPLNWEGGRVPHHQIERKGKIEFFRGTDHSVQVEGPEVSSYDIPLWSGTKGVEIDRLSYQTRQSIVNVLVEAVFNVESTASQIEIAKSAIVHLLGISPRFDPIEMMPVIKGDLGDAARLAIPRRDWMTYEVIGKITKQQWDAVAQAVITKYWELSTVPGQPAG